MVLRLPNACYAARRETDLRHHRDSLEPTSNGSSIKHPRRCAQPSAHHQNLAILAGDQRFSQCHAESRGLVFRHVRDRPASSSVSTISCVDLRNRISPGINFLLISSLLPHNTSAPLSFSYFICFLLSEPALVVPFQSFNLLSYILVLAAQAYVHFYDTLHDTQSSHNEVLHSTTLGSRACIRRDAGHEPCSCRRDWRDDTHCKRILEPYY